MFSALSSYILLSAFAMLFLFCWVICFILTLRGTHTPFPLHCNSGFQIFIQPSTLIARLEFISTVMPMLKGFVDKAFRKKIEKQVYENEHLLYDIVRSVYLFFHSNTNYSQSSADKKYSTLNIQ